MINTQGMSPETIRKVGLQLLNKELGADATIEFLQYYSRGFGDYTKEREELLNGQTVDSLSKELFTLQESDEV